MCEFHGYLLLLNYIPKETTQRCKNLKAYELMFLVFFKGGGVLTIYSQWPQEKKSTFTANNNIKNQYHTRLL